MSTVPKRIHFLAAVALAAAEVGNCVWMGGQNRGPALVGLPLHIVNSKFERPHDVAGNGHMNLIAQNRGHAGSHSDQVAATINAQGEIVELGDASQYYDEQQRDDEPFGVDASTVAHSANGSSHAEGQLGAHAVLDAVGRLSEMLVHDRGIASLTCNKSEESGMEEEWRSGVAFATAQRTILERDMGRKNAKFPEPSPTNENIEARALTAQSTFRGSRRTARQSLGNAQEVEEALLEATDDHVTGRADHALQQMEDAEQLLRDSLLAELFDGDGKAMTKAASVGVEVSAIKSYTAGRVREFRARHRHTVHRESDERAQHASSHDPSAQAASHDGFHVNSESAHDAHEFDFFNALTSSSTSTDDAWVNTTPNFEQLDAGYDHFANKQEQANLWLDENFSANVFTIDNSEAVGSVHVEEPWKEHLKSLGLSELDEVDKAKVKQGAEYVRPIDAAPARDDDTATDMDTEETAPKRKKDSEKAFANEHELSEAYQDLLDLGFTTEALAVADVDNDGFTSMREWMTLTCNAECFALGLYVRSVIGKTLQANIEAARQSALRTGPTRGAAPVSSMHASASEIAALASMAFERYPWLARLKEELCVM